MQVALGVAALGWALQAFLRSDDITHLMSVLFIALICIAITRNGLARPTALLFSQLREDKMQTLEELRVSEQRYRTVFEQSPAALFLFDTSLRVTGCNARLAELLRSPEESIIGADLRDLGEPNLTAVSESALGGSSGSMRESSVWAQAATSSGSRSARRRCSTRRSGQAAASGSSWT